LFEGIFRNYYVGFPRNSSIGGREVDFQIRRVFPENDKKPLKQQD